MPYYRYFMPTLQKKMQKKFVGNEKSSIFASQSKR